MVTCTIKQVIKNALEYAFLCARLILIGLLSKEAAGQNRKPSPPERTLEPHLLLF